MQPTIKAIPTYYAGVEFRSRLEARWAVFFDAIKLKWIYEHEGFYLDEGGHYLPDFYLPAIDSYFEVKPFDVENFNYTLDGITSFAKPAMLSAQINKPVYVGGNFPATDGEYYTYSDLIVQINPTNLTAASLIIRTCCLSKHEMKVITQEDDVCDYLDNEFNVCELCGAPVYRYFVPKNSAVKARSAKFEHGRAG